MKAIIFWNEEKNSPFKSVTVAEIPTPAHDSEIWNAEICLEEGFGYLRISRTRPLDGDSTMIPLGECETLEQLEELMQTAVHHIEIEGRDWWVSDDAVLERLDAGSTERKMELVERRLERLYAERDALLAEEE